MSSQTQPQPQPSSTVAAPDANTKPTAVKFELSDAGKHGKPLGEGKYIRTAGCLIIGDEVLNGKTRDSNSNFFAKHMFDLGIELKRIEVIADDEDEIIEAARRMVDKYDFVVTSGGIGPTHDDITYPSIAKAFDMPLTLNTECASRMQASIAARGGFQQQTPEQVEARQRMAMFPTGQGAEVLFVQEDKWVPVVRVMGKLCIFPGIPSLFEQLLIGLTPYLPLPPDSAKPFRHLIFTEMPESSIAPFLTELHNRERKNGVRVGSYPMLYKGVHVSLIGLDEAKIRELGKEVAEKLNGQVVEAAKQGA
ncbi:hypothetical protein NliqN6_3043 [Naganishia liquefaciens]|uniref:MoaB/Mog domain-containing protein n=1 Tax=Naganishia liquefaciens TaxID=104408 RepID=A0A8H3TSI7_9TREE|nr:hypothetical protein NliqN6_3043 [Naganishia liquefaciens]